MKSFLYFKSFDIFAQKYSDLPYINFLFFFLSKKKGGEMKKNDVSHEQLKNQRRRIIWVNKFAEGSCGVFLGIISNFYNKVINL